MYCLFYTCTNFTYYNRKYRYFSELDYTLEQITLFTNILFYQKNYAKIQRDGQRLLTSS